MGKNKFGKEIPSIYKRYNTIFIHIPKCAGSSISLKLFGHRVGHTSIKKFWELDSEFVKRAYKFTFVRHPYIRLWSAFKYIKQGGISIYDAQKKEQLKEHLNSFEDLISLIENNNEMLRILHLTPQNEFISIPNNKRYGLYVDYVGKTEFLDKEVEIIKPELPDILSKRLTNIEDFFSNTTKGTLEPPLEQSLLNRVYKLYQDDFELFGYEYWTTVDKIKSLL